MNRAVTSREELIAIAKKIAGSEGFDKISIRRIATECQVAVGSIYNYFPTKTDLLAAVIENLWQNAVHGIDWKEAGDCGFLECVGFVYQRLYRFLHGVEEDGIIKLSAQDAEVKQRRKEIEEACFLHMKQGLLAFLERDDRIPSSVFNQNFSKEDLIQFVFEHMMILLRNQQEDCRFLLEVIRRLVYQEV